MLLVISTFYPVQYLKKRHNVRSWEVIFGTAFLRVILSEHISHFKTLLVLVHFAYSWYLCPGSLVFFLLKMCWIWQSEECWNFPSWKVEFLQQHSNDHYRIHVSDMVPSHLYRKYTSLRILPRTLSNNLRILPCRTLLHILHWDEWTELLYLQRYSHLW